MQKLVERRARSWGMKDSSKLEARDKGYVKQATITVDYARVNADPSAPFGSPSFEKWLDHYKIFEEVEKITSEATPKQARL